MSLGVSTATLNNSLLRPILDIESQIVQAQQEVATGRVADLGLSLGAGDGRDYSLAASLQEVQTITETNKLVTTRLDVTQAVLATLSSSATNLESTLLAAQTDGGSPVAITTGASAALRTLISNINSTDGVSYIFGGINSAAPPLKDYAATPAPANKKAVDKAFADYFGYSQSDPRVASITAAQIQGFLNGPFAAIFSDSGWKADWSSASDQPLQSRINLSQSLTTSVTANDPALQKLAAAYTSLSEFGIENLSSSAYQAVIQSAAQQLDAGVAGLNKTQTTVGVIQQNVANASGSLTVQSNYLSTAIDALEQVDPYAAGTKLNSLTTQLETSYALTAKIQQLSLVKFL